MIKNTLLFLAIFVIAVKSFSFESVSHLGDYLSVGESADNLNIIPKRDVLKTLNDFCNSEILNRQNCSIMGDSFDYDSKYLFGQKEQVSFNDQVAIWGDIHGSINSIYKSLKYLCDKGILDDQFYIKSKRFKMVFLGDYVDRGVDGIEVILVLAQLKLKNPDQVFILRGNHEDLSMNRDGGFKKELEDKYGYSSKDILKAVDLFYDQLPVVMFLGHPNANNGTDFIQLCHGGIEIGYNPKEFLALSYNYQLIKYIDRAKYIKILPIAMQKLIESRVPKEERLNFELRGLTNPYNLGLCWSDFITLGPDNDINFSFGRGLRCGKNFTLHYLDNASSEKSKLKMIIRGHQHNGSMLEDLIRARGFSRIWQDLVITLCSAPVGRFKESSFVIMSFGSGINIEFEHVVL